MSIRRLCIYLLFAVLYTVMQTQIFSNGEDLLAGRNVNMVTNDPYLQRQNEPSLAVSTLNPRHLLAGANDYSLVDFFGDEVDVTYDAWLGVFKSFDGGESWSHDLLPPYEGVLAGGSPDTSHPLSGFDAAADPTIRAGIDGWFFYSGIAFDREKNGDSVVFVVRYKDTGNDIVYHDTKIIATGTSGQFSDKPWSVMDVPRPGYPKGIVYIVHSIFLGQTNPNLNIHSKIHVSRSIDGGETYEDPVKVSTGEQKNQGTIVAVDPNDGTVYVAWRRFPSVNVPHGILIAKSDDFGLTFTKAVEVATPLRPFDQNTIKGGQFFPAQFRTSAFPAMAVDQYGTIHIAWSQRDVDYFADDARIVIASQAKEAWGAVWDYIPVESPVTIYDPRNGGANIPIHSHQFMPSLTCGAGKLMIAWYDNRYSTRVFDEYGSMRDPYPCLFGESTTDTADRIIDYWPETNPYACDYRETIDVRAAQAIPIQNDSLNIGASMQVSRYIWVLDELEEPEDPDKPYIPIQGQFNPPNYKLFSAGTAPFHGDYLDIAPAPMLIDEGGGNWRFSTEGDPFVFYTSWTDNRDVLPPNLLDLWADYTPPVLGTCDGETAGMRNQNIYVSKLAPGIEVDVLGEFINDDGIQVFVIYINNKTGSPFEDPITEPQYKRFELNIDVPEGAASFFPADPPPDNTNKGRTIVVNVPDNSSISRMVFAPSVTYPFEVQITEDETTGDFIDSISLEPGISPIMTGGTSITEFELDFINWSDPPYNPPIDPQHPLGDKLIANPNILAPNILAPNILAPNILAPNILAPNILAPNILAPNILAPNILAPNILAPNILAPNILAMSILNPNILAPNILATPPGPETEVVDKIWTVTNNTNAASSYTFKSIAGDPLPAGIVYVHLLIFKEHTIPSTDGCSLKDQVQHELLVNVTNPYLIEAILPEEIDEITGDPNVEFENATFSLGPYEEGIVILRVIDTHSSLLITAQGGQLELDEPTPPPTPPTEAESFAGNLGGLAVTHTSTEGAPVSAITLTILPGGLPTGKAGVQYDGATIRAIGGTGSYSWALIDGLLPEGLTWTTFNDLIDDPDFGNMFVISGMPKEAGPFSFTVEVTDSSVPDAQSDTQGFTIDIDDPDPLTITMTWPDPPYGVKYSLYSGLTFTVSGGVLPYTWDLSGAPANLTKNISGSNGETMEIKGKPQFAEDFDVAVTVNDEFLPINQEATEEFILCIKPLPLIINAIPSPLPEGYLGSSYQATLSVSNAEETPSWQQVSGLPPGLGQSGISGYSITITGVPTYDPNVTYPKTYNLDVQVTDQFTSSCLTRGWISKTFTITIHPKAPAWAIEGVDGEATAIAADSSGNVYVTGYTNGANKDYYTVKIEYNTETGKWEEVWSEQYNGPGNGEDIPSAIAIAVDSSGVYVTGSSVGRKTGPDIYTVKYDLTDGHVLKEARYDGPSHLGDGANDLVLDETGNVYVAGYVHRGKQTKHADYCTIKYSSSLNMLWDEKYDSRRNGNDIVTAIAVDSWGNVYITGKSQESLPKGPTTHDYLTMKYDSSGSFQWLKRDDGPSFGDDEPTDIALHEVSSNEVYIYVTGYTGTKVGEDLLEKDYYTVKYDAADGSQAWSMAYNGLLSGDDVARAIAVDESSGDVYVTGKSIGTNGYDYATIKYGSDYGTLLWNKRYDGQVGDDEAVAIGVDGTDIYVAGFISKAPNKDFFVIEYNTSGDIIWIAQYDGPSQKDDVATAMAVNSTGVYVTGFSMKDITRSVFATVKFEK